MRKLINKWHEFNSIRELKNAAPKLNKEAEGLSYSEILDLIYGNRWNRFFWIKQVREEIQQLCDIVSNRKPKNVLEIGTASGGSLFLFSKLAASNAHIISIDLPEGEFGGGYPEYKSQFYKSFANSNQKMSLIRDDSHKITTLEKVKSILIKEKIDFLFIDGDHTYQGVKKDFELYSPLVQNNGIIAFHDIAEHPKDWNVGVGDFWREIKINYKNREIIKDINQGWAGIGVLYSETS